MAKAPNGERPHRTLELAYSHNELLRAFPKIFESLATQIQGTTITLTEGEKKVVVTLGEERERRLGAEFKLPETRIDFVFHGYSEEEADAIFKTFIVRTRRGGG